MAQSLERLKHLALVLVFAASASAALPSADEILSSVRLRQAQQQIDLQGQLREGELIVPFRLVQSGSTVQYIFPESGTTLQLQIGERESQLEEISPTGEKHSTAQFDQRIRGTNLTYEDIALKFLYWPNPTVLGDQNIRTRDCWKLQLLAPSRDSQYGTVWLWVDKNSGALMRMEGYNPKGQLIKRFEVVSAQKIEGRWFLKQMRIEEIQPSTNKVLSRTYLEIKK